MNTQDWSPLGWTGWISLQSKGLSRVFSNTTVQQHQLFSAQLSSQSNSHMLMDYINTNWSWSCISFLIFFPFGFDLYFPWTSLVAQRLKCLPRCGRPGFDPWVGKIPWRRKWQPTPVFLPGKFHGQRNLEGPRGRKESDMTERLHSLTMTN